MNELPEVHVNRCALALKSVRSLGWAHFREIFLGIPGHLKIDVAV